MAGRIEHVVVLMLENRSFDSMLGRLYAQGTGFEGLSGNESNPHAGAGAITVWGNTATDPASMSIPDPDPGELWTDINMQLFGLNGTPGAGVPSMDGFVDSYVRQVGNPDARAIMHCYEPTQVPVISQLAKQFAVSDQWFASAPCQTWPNRFFLHCATANGYENNSPTHFPYMMDTVFNRFEDAGRPWGIYFHDFPQTLTLARLWPHLGHFRPFDDFLDDARNGNLPDYAFIEPRYFPDTKLPNDQHPPHNVGLGEDLIASVYNAVRQSPAWEKTLLVIIYDEHGGCYDHVRPPLAVPPDDAQGGPFGFDRYGVRVPAVLVSPYTKAGTVLRSVPGGNLPHKGPPYPFDHTSVFATLRRLFGDLGGPLTRRDRVAPDLLGVLNLDAPDNDGPVSISLHYPIGDDELRRARAAPLNAFQKAMQEAAFYLPDLGGDGAPDKIEDHLRKIADGVLGDVPGYGTMSDAVPFIKQRLAAFLGR